jgi:ELMO domain-containing protein
MGILSLENLLYFSREYSDSFRHLLSHSQHPRYGYTLAVIGINITHMAWRLLKSGLVKNHFYNLSRTHGAPSIEYFHQFYCYLLYEFDQLWLHSKPDNLMEFTHVQARFEQWIVKISEKDNCHFKMNLSVDNV